MSRGKGLFEATSITGLPCGSAKKSLPVDTGKAGLIPGPGRSPGEGDGNPLQYSCLENPMHRGVWQAIVNGVTKSQRRLSDFTLLINGLPRWLSGKGSAHQAGDVGLIPGSGRSPGEGNGNPLQYSCLENSMERGAWWATVRGVTKSQTRLSDFTSLSIKRGV